MTDLPALVTSWLIGDSSAGPALHDALEEAGWPLEWHTNGRQLLAAGVPVAEVWYSGDIRGWRVAVRDRPVRHVDSGRGEVGQEVAKSAAISAFRRALTTSPTPDTPG